MIGVLTLQKASPSTKTVIANRATKPPFGWSGFFSWKVPKAASVPRRTRAPVMDDMIYRFGWVMWMKLIRGERGPFLSIQRTRQHTTSAGTNGTRAVLGIGWGSTSDSVYLVCTCLFV